MCDRHPVCRRPGTMMSVPLNMRTSSSEKHVLSGSKFLISVSLRYQWKGPSSKLRASCSTGKHATSVRCIMGLYYLPKLLEDNYKEYPHVMRVLTVKANQALHPLAWPLKDHFIYYLVLCEQTSGKQIINICTCCSEGLLG